MNKIKGLRTVFYKVEDITEAKTWHSKAFKTEPYFDDVFYVGFNIAGYELGLQPADEPSSNKAESVAAYWGVNDVAETYKDFIPVGATENEAPQNVGSDIVVATVKDPWNNVIGFIHNPGFKAE